MTEPTRVSMTAITHHSFDAKVREPGETYEVDPQYVETLIALHFARRTDELHKGSQKRTPTVAVHAAGAVALPAAATPTQPKTK